MRWFFVGVLALACLANAEEICLSGDEDPYLLFGTKTAYTFASRGIPTHKSHEIPGCQPIAFWLLARHGSHNPEADEIDELQKLADLKNNIVSNYRNGNFRNTNQRICVSDLNLLERWEWNGRMNASFAGNLTSDGYISTQQLAQAWKQRFPGLLTDNRHDYLFKFPKDPRLMTSYRAFTEGLFRSQADDYDIPKENDDKFLTTFKNCPAWAKDEEENDLLSQVRTFESKQEYKEMISNISLRLGFNYDIQKEIVKSIYEMCRYNKAWNVVQISPWCAAFSHEDLKRLEYAEDLETYYRYGYGSPMKDKIGCTVIKDMMNFFKNHSERDNPQQPRAVIHLTEAPMILQMLAGSGARRDPAPLTGDNYHTNLVQARKWTTSTMVPFNANIAAILYRCTPNGNFQVREQHQVLFLENERPMYLEGCRVGLCDWSYVQTRFGDLTNNCEVNCNSASSINGFLAITLTTLLCIVRNLM